VARLPLGRPPTLRSQASHGFLDLTGTLRTRSHPRSGAHLDSAAWRPTSPVRARASARASSPRSRASRSSPCTPRPTSRTQRDRASRRVPVHARRVREHVPGPAVDDAAVRRLRHGGGDQRALPLPARPRADRPVDRVRHAVAHGPRLRQPAVAGRGRARGRRRRRRRRHGDALSRASTSATSACR
jgi:hypothetical protein